MLALCGHPLAAHTNDDQNAYTQNSSDYANHSRVHRCTLSFVAIGGPAWTFSRWLISSQTTAGPEKQHKNTPKASQSNEKIIKLDLSLGHPRHSEGHQPPLSARKIIPRYVLND